MTGSPGSTMGKRLWPAADRRRGGNARRRGAIARRSGGIARYSPSARPRISRMISSLPPPIGPRRASRAARSTQYSRM